MGAAGPKAHQSVARGRRNWRAVGRVAPMGAVREEPCAVVAGGPEVVKTELIVSIEFPALDLHQIFHCAMRPAQLDRRLLWQRLGEFAQEVNEEMQGVMAVEKCGNTEKLEALRSRAKLGLEEWTRRLKSAEEGLSKVAIAKQTMNTMRENYYKELMQLREQLHLREKTEKDGKEFRPDDYRIFDPTEYTFGDEYDDVLKMKATALQKVYEGQKQHWLERLDKLAQTLQTKTMLLQRKDQLLRALLEELGYADSTDFEKAVDDKEAAKAQQAKVQRAEAPSGNKRVPLPHAPLSNGWKALLAKRTLIVLGASTTTAEAVERATCPKKTKVQLFCGGCQNAMREEDRRCGKCGRTPTDADVSAEVSQACSCGATFVPDGDFCRTCGRDRPGRPRLPADAAMDETSRQSEELLAVLKTGSTEGLLARARHLVNRKVEKPQGPQRVGGQGRWLGAEAGDAAGSAARPGDTTDCGTQSAVSGLEMDEVLALLEERRKVHCATSPNAGDASRGTPRGKSGRFLTSTSETLALSACRPRLGAKATKSQLGTCRTSSQGSLPTQDDNMSDFAEDHKSTLTLSVEHLPGVVPESAGQHSRSSSPTPASPSKLAATQRRRHLSHAEEAVDSVAEILSKHGVPVKGLDTYVDEPDVTPVRPKSKSVISGTMFRRGSSNGEMGPVTSARLLRRSSGAEEELSLALNSVVAVAPIAVGGSGEVARTAAAAVALAKYNYERPSTASAESSVSPSPSATPGRRPTHFGAAVGSALQGTSFSRQGNRPV